MDQKTSQIEAFTARAYRDKEAMELLKSILETGPDALMFTWEVEGSMKIATLPKSISLARGMTEVAYGLMWPNQEEAED